MKRKTRSLTTAGLALALTVGGLTGASTSATAGTTPTFSCGVVGDGGSDFVVLWGIYPNPCFVVQVRMFRYESSTIKTYLGAQAQANGQSGGTSVISYSNGTNAGNSGRVRVSSPSTFSGWFGLPPSPAGYLRGTGAAKDVHEGDLTEALAHLSEIPAPSSAEIMQAKESATSTLEKEALSDGAVSESEYRTAYSNYASCMNGKGWPTSVYSMSEIDAIGLRIEGRAEGEKFDSDLDSCRAGTVEIIEPIYLMTEVFPKLSAPK